MEGKITAIPLVPSVRPRHSIPLPSVHGTSLACQARPCAVRKARWGFVDRHGTGPPKISRPVPLKMFQHSNPKQDWRATSRSILLLVQHLYVRPVLRVACHLLLRQSVLRSDAWYAIARPFVSIWFGTNGCHAVSTERFRGPKGATGVTQAETRFEKNAQST